MKSYTKSGKKGARPGKGPGEGGRQVKSEKLGSPYFWRAQMGESDETRMKQLYSNEYGKKAVPQPEEGKAVPVSPRKTIIHPR